MGRKMSKAEKRRKMQKRKCFDDKDIRAKAEGKAIDKMKVIGPVQPSRLRMTYYVDGVPFRTGQKHRGIG